MKKCTTKREIDKQVFFSDLQQFHKLVFQRGYGQKTKGKGKHMC